MSQLNCNISYSTKEIQAITASLITGFLELESEGLIKINEISGEDNFKKIGFLHNAIILVNIDGRKIAFDTADGYQSIQKKDMFDECLDKVDAYFKISYDPHYQKGMRNENKVMPLGITLTGLLCKKHPLLIPSLKSDSLITFLWKIKNYRNNLQEHSIENLISNNSYDSYKLLFWTRLWESNTTDEQYNRYYPYLSSQEAHFYNSQNHEMIEQANRFRIDVIKFMKQQFGDKFVYGIYNNTVAQNLCPELLHICPELDTKPSYNNSLKKNYICINTDGLHYCYGAKVAEFLSAGRAIISQPFHYKLPNDLKPNDNFISCNTPDAMVNAADSLINDIEKIKYMEKSNHEYFLDNCLPSHIVYQALKSQFQNL